MDLLTNELKKRFQEVGYQDALGEDAIVVAHFFHGGSDWLATEYIEEDRVFFGFGCLNNDVEMAEMGYFSLQEFEEFNEKNLIGIERDIYWDEITLKEAKKKLKLNRK